MSAAAAPVIPTPTNAIIDRLPPETTTKIPRETILKLVKIVDSYHDFKSSKRVNVAASPAGASAASAQEAAAGRAASPKKSPGSQFHIILNNIFNRVITTIDADTFFKNNGVSKSSPENSGRLFFEKECTTALDASAVLGTVPTRVTCSSFNPESLTSYKTLLLELDKGFDQTDANNASAGQRLLEWFFPGRKSGGIGFNFDAQSAILKDFMQPRNNKSAGFYAAQIVTPQNVFDSASSISYYVLVDKRRTYELFTTQESRTEYISPTPFEFSNLFTEEFGDFSIERGSFGDNRSVYTDDFKWVFTTKDAKSRHEMNMQGGHRNTGPSVTFLASLIDCLLREKEKPQACWDLKEAQNGRMISPVPTIKEFMTLPDAQKKFIIRLLFDIKRLGDHEQANSVYYYNNTRGNAYTTIFVTGDILSALYSRLLGNPTIYIRAAGEDADDEDDGSSITNPYLLCYRGVDIIRDTREQAYINVQNLVTQLNYFLFTISSFISLSKTEDLTVLINNLLFYQDKMPFVGEYSGLKNSLLKAKVKNSLEFLNNLTEKAAPLTSILERERETLTTLLVDSQATTSDAKRYHLGHQGLNIKVNKMLDEATYVTIKETLEASMKALAPKMNLLMVDLQHFNKIKFETKEIDATIFSFHNTLFFSETTPVDTLDTINFKMEQIDAIIRPVSAIVRGPRAQQLELSKERLQQKCYEFLDGFFTTNGFEKATMLSSLQEIINSINPINVVQHITGLFDQISDMATTPVAEVVIAANSALERDYAVALSQSFAAEPAATHAAVDLVAGKASTSPLLNVLGMNRLGDAALANQLATVSETAATTAGKIVAAAALVRSKSLPSIPTYVRTAADPVTDAVKRAALAVSLDSAYTASEAAENTLRRNSSNLEAIPRHPPDSSGSRGGARGGALDPMILLMEDVFKNIVDTIYAIHDINPDSISLVPGNAIKQLDIFPHPYPYVEERTVKPFIMRTGHSVLAEQVPFRPLGYTRKRKQLRSRTRRNRKQDGGDYVWIKTYIRSRYDSLTQAKLTDTYLDTIRDYAINIVDRGAHTQAERAAALATALADPINLNKIRDKWYYFTSLLDSKGTPDLAEVKVANGVTRGYAYDVRMLKTYVTFPNRIAELLSLDDPLGNMKVGLTAEEVSTYLDPQETLRIGSNNMIAYTELLGKNTRQLTELNALQAREGKYNKNIALCECNIAFLTKDIAATKQLINLNGVTIPAQLIIKLGTGVQYDAEAATAPLPEPTDADVAAYLANYEGAAASARAPAPPAKGSKRRSRKRSNNTRRNL